MAGVLGYLYFAGGDSKGDHPFKAIPDFYGQYEKANRKSLSFKGMPDPKGDVPADLRVKLGEEITVGDIQVRPVSVQTQVFELNREHTSKDNIVSKSSTGLVMALKVKNVSTDTTFYPNDLAFNRDSIRTNRSRIPLCKFAASTFTEPSPGRSMPKPKTIS